MNFTWKTLCASITVYFLLISCIGRQSNVQELSLKDFAEGKFLIGTAVNAAQTSGRDTLGVEILKKHFNSIVAENCMKCAVIHPEEERYDFSEADEFVRFGEANDMVIIGHCLIWHSQCAPWFLVDENGKNVSPEVLKQRMKKHISTVVGRYKGRVKGWDVVNEAILTDGSYRNSGFYQILGEEFIPLAFQYAHEADPDAELYLNDYGMDASGRCDTYIAIIKELKKRGLRIDAIGMQSHLGMCHPDITEYEESLKAFSATGVKVMITELDLSALPEVHRVANIADTVAYQKRLNPYVKELPDSVSMAWNNRMTDFFDLYLKHADVISRVTVWGVSDKDSWKNDFPVHGRTDYPLFFDRNHQMKPFLKDILKTE